MAKVQLTALEQYHATSDVIGHVDALALLSQAYVDALNARLASEIKYPDWHPDAEEQFEQVEAELMFVTNEMAERTTRMLLPSELRAFHNANDKASHDRYLQRR
jgi:hypothetical protein